MAAIDFECAADLEFDAQEAKMRRACARSRSCHRKRAEFERSRTAREQRWLARQQSFRASHSVPPPAANLHGAARAATRTCLSRGAVETAADMPCVLKGEDTGSKAAHYNRRRSSVSCALKSTGSPALEFQPWATAAAAEHGFEGFQLDQGLSQDGTQDMVLVQDDLVSTAASSSPEGASLADERDDQTGFEESAAESSHEQQPDASGCPGEGESEARDYAAVCVEDSAAVHNAAGKQAEGEEDNEMSAAREEEEEEQEEEARAKVREMTVAAEKEISTMRTRATAEARAAAEAEAQAIRAQPLAEALGDRAAEQARAHAQAQAQDAEEWHGRDESERRADGTVEAKAQRGKDMKLARVLERQRAKQFRREAEQARREAIREREAESRRARAVAVHEQALATARAVEQEAFEEAAMELTLAAAQVAATHPAAEAQACEIRAKAEPEAQAIEVEICRVRTASLAEPQSAALGWAGAAVSRHSETQQPIEPEEQEWEMVHENDVWELA